MTITHPNFAFMELLASISYVVLRVHALILQANEPLGVYILVSATRQIAGHIYIVKRENERGRQRETPQYVVGDRNSLFNVFHHLVPLFLLTFPLSIFMVDRGGKPKWFYILSYG
jgi:hypothetical protein